MLCLVIRFQTFCNANAKINIPSLRSFVQGTLWLLLRIRWSVDGEWHEWIVLQLGLSGCNLVEIWIGMLDLEGRLSALDVQGEMVKEYIEHCGALLIVCLHRVLRSRCIRSLRFIVLVWLYYLYSLGLRLVIYIVVWYPRLQLIYFSLVAPDHESEGNECAYAGNNSYSNAGRPAGR
jgi:hypothetical protein